MISPEKVAVVHNAVDVAGFRRGARVHAGDVLVANTAIYGNQADNALNGSLGNDTLYGNAGADSLAGCAGKP